MRGSWTSTLNASSSSSASPSSSWHLAMHTGPRLYKVKWHHLLHLPDDLKRMGKMLSCFPMERKHKAIKIHMVNSFRSCEHTAVCSYLNSTITSIITGLTRFVEEYLIDPVDGRSANAVLRCGRVCTSGMALIIDMHGERALGEVKGFLLADDLVFAHVVQLAPCSRTCMKR